MLPETPAAIFAIGIGVRTPATTSSPCALIRNSPISFFSPVAGSRVNATPVPHVISHVTECHCLYVYCSTPAVWDIIITTVYIRTRVVPGTEYCFDQRPLTAPSDHPGNLAPIFALYSSLNCRASSFRSFCCQINVHVQRPFSLSSHR